MNAIVITAFICMLAAAMPAARAANQPSTPDEARIFAQAGAAGLALKMADAGEAASTSEPSTWGQWERLRIAIYQSQHDWHAIIARAGVLPPGISDALHGWVLLQAAEAALALDNGTEARKALRERLRLLGTTSDPAAERQVDLLMAQSFVIDGRLDDAAAMLAIARGRAKAHDEAELDVAQARLALRRHRPGQAFAFLANKTDIAIEPLRWLAGLRAGNLLPALVYRHAKAYAAAKHPDDAIRAALIVAAEAAQDLRRPAERIVLLERALTIYPAITPQPPFVLTADTIWRALDGYGQAFGNDRKLMVGDDAAWFALVAKQGRQTIAAQALLAVVALHGFDAADRSRAHAALAGILLKRPSGNKLLEQLYLHDARFPTPASIPAPVRARLAAAAYAADDMPTAAALYADLDTPPDGADPASWQLVRARALILGGHADAGVAALDKLLAGAGGFSIDKLLPDLFALQAVGRDADAARFFQQLLVRKPPPDVHQKLLYWLADSEAALGRQVAAARLYLESATALSATAMDPWAQTARYHAAGALAAAGLVDDARTIYTRLLGATSDPARQAELRQKIGALAAKTGTAKTLENPPGNH